MQALSTASSLLCISTGDLAHPHICFWAMCTRAHLIMIMGSESRHSEVSFFVSRVLFHIRWMFPLGETSGSPGVLFGCSRLACFVLHLCLTSVAEFITQLNQFSKELGRWVLREQSKHSFPMQHVIGKYEPRHDWRFLLWYLCFCWLMPYHCNLTWFWSGVWAECLLCFAHTSV